MESEKTGKDMNVPTTGEIVAALSAYCGNCYDENCTDRDCEGRINRLAADRLELLERESAALTARAEQAEALINDMITAFECGAGLCTICAKRSGWDTCKPCEFEYRGLPQDGEGK